MKQIEEKAEEVAAKFLLFSVCFVVVVFACSIYLGELIEFWGGLIEAANAGVIGVGGMIASGVF